MGMLAQEIKLLGTIKKIEPPKPEPQEPNEPEKPNEPQQPSQPQSPVVPYIPSPGITTDNKQEDKKDTKKLETKEIEATNDETPQGKITEKITTFTKNNLSYKIMNDSSNFAKILRNNTIYKKLTIPASVKHDGNTFKISELGDRSFKGKKHLKTVVIGKNVTKIGKECFASCSNLTFIEFKGTKIISIGKDAFKGISTKVKVKIPANMSKKERAKLKKMLIKAKISKNIVIE